MSHLLSRPPEEAVRLIALTLLARVEEAVTRLDEADDPEALHRFRVSVRRLRSVLRAYRKPLEGSVRKRDRRRLRDLAALTGEGRDAEVAAAWLEEQRPHLDAGQQQGLDWLRRRFEARRGEGYEEARTTIAGRMLPLADDLRQRLGVYTRQVSLGGRGGGDLFGELVSHEVLRELQRLETLLARVDGPHDTTSVHDARLSAKRLRYLLEPLSPELSAIDPLVKRLKRLQDLLGELNDAYVLERELEDAVDTAARRHARHLLDGALGHPAPSDPATADAASADRASGRDEDWGPVDGLLALARHNRERRDRLFGDLRQGWLAASPEVASGEAASGESGSGEAGSGEAEEAPAVAPRLRELADGIRDLAHWLEAGFSPPPPARDEPSPTTAP